MLIKLDENIPVVLKNDLEALGHNVDTVASENLQGAPDARVWLAAQQELRLFITQDLDFSDKRKFAPGTHSGILLVRLHEPGRLHLRAKILEAIKSQDFNVWHQCFVVLTDHKIRVSKP
jgi:predicted nuclease of predicted toxin-antitoxin system